jgi:hypothetical protein
MAHDPELSTTSIEMTSGLKFMLWFELVLYGLIGVFEIFDDFFPKAKWNMKFVENNAFVKLTFKGMLKMHASICCVLAFIAGNGLMSDSMGQFEMELNFFTLGLIMSAVWATIMPNPLYIIVVLLKPEFYIQIALWVNYTEYVRPWVLYVCAFLNAWGIFVRVSVGFVPNPAYFEPFTYEELRKSIVEAEPELVEKMDKLVGFKPESSEPLINE